MVAVIIFDVMREIDEVSEINVDSIHLFLIFGHCSMLAGWAIWPKLIKYKRGIKYSIVCVCCFWLSILSDRHRLTHFCIVCTLVAAVKKGVFKRDNKKPKKINSFSLCACLLACLFASLKIASDLHRIHYYFVKRQSILFA